MEVLLVVGPTSAFTGRRRLMECQGNCLQEKSPEGYHSSMLLDLILPTLNQHIGQLKPSLLLLHQ